MKKTKAMLQEEIEKKEQELEVLRNVKKKYELYEGLDEAARGIKALQESFINVGFTREEALELTRDMVNQAVGLSLRGVR